MKRFILAFKRSIEQLLQKIFLHRSSVSAPTSSTEVVAFVDTENGNALTGVNSDNEEIVLAQGVARPL